MDNPIDILWPDPGLAEEAALRVRLGDLARQPNPEPFSDVVLSFCRDLSESILKDDQARRFPELKAFAFWTRPKALEALARHHQALVPDRGVMTGKGVLFHLPPANVALLFAYNWILGLLAGNRAIVRLSSRRQEQADILLRLIRDGLAACPDIGAGQLFLSYGHDDSVTALLSSVCDLRVVWGGDATVSHLREIPLPPSADEISFGDRFSLAAFKARAILDLSDEERRFLAEDLYNDIFWFDQMACSSPRLIVWVGDKDEAAAAGKKLYAALAETSAAKGYAPDAGVLSAKLAYTYRAMLDWPVTRMKMIGGRLMVLSLERFADFREDVFGAGTLFDLVLPDLDALAPSIRRKDQTLVHFGFSARELAGFVRLLGGRGLDRLVPPGQALSFGAIWDGHDLLGEFSKVVIVESLLS